MSKKIALLLSFILILLSTASCSAPEESTSIVEQVVTITNTDLITYTDKELIELQKILNAELDSRNLLQPVEELKDQIEKIEDDSKQEPTKPTASAPVTQPETTSQYDFSFGFVDYSIFSNFCADGIFRCGSDFEPGEYYIISLYDAQTYCDVADNPNKFVWDRNKIIRKVVAQSGQYVNANDAILISSNQLRSEFRNKYGIFLVGEDIPMGDYKVTTIDTHYKSDFANISGIDGAYQICDSFGNTLHCSDVHESQAYISVEEGQYLIINNLNLEHCG